MKNKFPIIVLSLLLFLSPAQAQMTMEEALLMEIQLTSQTFQDEGMIPEKCTCDGEDVSPELSWTAIPGIAESFALVAEDPDAPAGTWVHWVVYNIPPSVSSLPEGVQPSEILDNGGMQGTNDFRKLGYGGPCPPSGTHRYYFKLYMLDKMLDLKPGATKKELLEAMKRHILAEGQLMGKYERK